MNFEKELTESWTKTLESSSPGDLAVAQIEGSRAVAERAESDKQADEAWRAAGNEEISYDHKQAYAEGVDFAKGELPNKFLTNKKVNYVGYDLATGHKYFDALEHDPYNLLQTSAKRLRTSSQTKDKEPPPKNIFALGNSAYAYFRAGRPFADFAKGAGPGHPNDYLQRAWRAGVDSANAESLRVYMETAHRRVPAELKQATRGYAENLADKAFSDSGRQIYKAVEGNDFAGNDLDASRWLANHLRWFDFNTAAQALTITRIKNADAKTMAAYTVAFEAWDNTEMEPSVLAQLGNLGRGLMDPMNLAGAGIGKVTVVTAGRLAVKEALRAMGARATVGAAGGATGGGLTEISRAHVQGKDPEGLNIAVSAAGGAIMGAGFSAAVPEVVDAGKLGLSRVWRNVEQMRPGPAAGGMRAQMGAVGDLSPIPPLPPFDPATGYYSPTMRAVAGMPQEKMTPEQLVGWLKSQKDIRGEELDFLDIEGGFEPGKAVTKAQYQEYIERMRPRIAVVKRGEEGSAGTDWLRRQSPEYDALLRQRDAIENQIDTLETRSRLAGQRVPDEELEPLTLRQAELNDDIIEIEARHFGDPDEVETARLGTRYGMHTLGQYGERPESNFREVLFVHQTGAQAKSPHWTTERGVVGSILTTDRMKRGSSETVSLAEEAQSDIHQDLAKATKRWREDNPTDPRSYEQMVYEEYREVIASRAMTRPEKTEEAGRLWSKLPEKWEDVSPGLRRQMLQDRAFWENASSQVVPKEVMANWTASAMRGGLYDAALRGKEWFAWAPSEVIQERKQAWGMRFDPGTEVKLTVHQDGSISAKGAEFYRGGTVRAAGVRKEAAGEWLARFKDSLSAEDKAKVEKLGKPSGEPITLHGVPEIEIGGRVYDGTIEIKREGQNFVITEKGKNVSRRPTVGIEVMNQFMEQLTKTGKKKLLKQLLDWKDATPNTVSVSVTKPFTAEEPRFKMYSGEMVNEANKFLKRYDTKVEKIIIDQDPKKPGGEQVAVHAIRITPELREKLLKGGVPLAVGGVAALGEKDDDKAE